MTVDMLTGKALGAKVVIPSRIKSIEGKRGTEDGQRSLIKADYYSNAREFYR